MIKIISNSRHKKMSKIEGINQAINKQLTCSCCESVFSFDDYNDVQFAPRDNLYTNIGNAIPIGHAYYYVRCPICYNKYLLAEV